MTKLDFTYVKINRNQLTSTTDYFNELFDQFTLDCNPEDLKEFPEAMRCWKELKILQKKIKIINKAERKVFGV
jgi:hypothetical protein